MEAKKRCLKCGGFAETTIGNEIECAQCGNPKGKVFYVQDARPDASHVADRLIKQVLGQKHRRVEQSSVKGRGNKDIYPPQITNMTIKLFDIFLFFGMLVSVIMIVVALCNDTFDIK